MERDYTGKGTPLINTMFGTVNAGPENFTATLEELTSKEDLREAIGAKEGPFCLVPEELDIPF